MKTLTHFLGFTGVGLIIFGLFNGSILPKKVADSQPNPLTQGSIFEIPKTEAKLSSKTGFIHTITVTVSHLEEIKVKEGEAVKKGQIISDRLTEKKALLRQREKLTLAQKQANLPLNETLDSTKSQFMQERMALQKAKIQLAQINLKIKNYPQTKFKDPELSAIFEPEKVKDLGNLQEQKIMATLAVNEALSRLHQAEIKHEIQLYNDENNLHKQKYQLQSLGNQILEIDEKLADLGAVRSPYNGYVHRVKILKQNDLNLSAEIILDVH